MAPSCEPPAGTHYARVDDWKHHGRYHDTTAGEGGGRGWSCDRDSYMAACTPSEQWGGGTMSSRVSCSEGTRRRSLRKAGCCRTNHEIPYGSHFPIEANLDSVGEWKSTAKPVRHLEYGYQASWRPSRVHLPIKDAMEPCVVTPANVEFRPSIRVIHSGTGAWSERWRAGRRYIEPSCGKEYQWRSSIRTAPQRGSQEMAFRPQVRPDPISASLETNEGNFRPIRRFIIPHTPLQQKAPYRTKRHIVRPSEWVPPFRLQGEDYNTAPLKQFGKARVMDYTALHPPLRLAWDVPGTAQPGSAPPTPDASGVVRMSSRKYIPSGHLSHFENKNCCVCKVGTGDIERKALRKRTQSGPYHDTVSDRNPIAGNMPETDVFRETRVARGPALCGPAGTINSDIIDHKFSGVGLFQRATPMSEMKDQFRHWEPHPE